MYTGDIYEEDRICNTANNTGSEENTGNTCRREKVVGFATN